MFFKTKNKPQSRIDTLIGTETRIEGDIHFKGGLRVDGHIRGNVSETTSPSTLVIGENGSIEGAIAASQMVVIGRVLGPVRATQFIELQATARITGDVHYKSLEMHTGALIEGRLVYLGEAESAADPLFSNS